MEFVAQGCTNDLAEKDGPLFWSAVGKRCGVNDPSRAQRYRAKSEQAECSAAEATDPKLKELFMRVAQHWRKMADAACDQCDEVSPEVCGTSKSELPRRL